MTRETAQLAEIARLLEFVPGINDERDSVPLLLAVKAVIVGLGYEQSAPLEIERLLTENHELRGLLQEVLDDIPMYRIDRMTEEKIRAVIKPVNWLDDLSRAEDKLIKK